MQEAANELEATRSPVLPPNEALLSPLHEDAPLPTTCPVLKLRAKELHLNLLGLVLDIPNLEASGAAEKGQGLDDLLFGLSRLLSVVGNKLDAAADKLEGKKKDSDGAKSGEPATAPAGKLGMMLNTAEGAEKTADAAEKVDDKAAAIS